MKARQRRTDSFNMRSMMLFAALSLGGMGAVQAQTSSPPSQQPMQSPAPDESAPPGDDGFTVGPGKATDSVFIRADIDRDGKLSPKEATRLPGIAQRFEELDTDRDGALSAAEFGKGMRP